MNQFQVIIFEGYEPIVTGGNPREITKHMQRFGLSIHHKYTTSYFATINEANEFARLHVQPTTNGFEEVPEVPEVKEEEPTATQILETSIFEEAKTSRKKKSKKDE